MNLDDLQLFQQMDTQNMLAQIDALPDQLEAAFGSGMSQDLPAWGGIRQVLLLGIGASGLAAELLASCAVLDAPVQVLAYPWEAFPAWARGPETLVIGLSHTGETRETLASFRSAVASGCRALAISGGGSLRAAAQENGFPAWEVAQPGPARAAIGALFGRGLAALTRLGVLPDPSLDLNRSVQQMRAQAAQINAQIPAARNPAKRMGGQMVGRLVTVFASGRIAPVARRWKAQINETAKAWAQADVLPGALYASLAGNLYPENVLERTLPLFLRASANTERQKAEIDMARQHLMLSGLNTDTVDAQGESLLENLWTLLHYGDYAAYYLAMAYGVDPTPADSME